VSPLIQDPTAGRKLQRGFRLTTLPDSVLAPEIVGVVILEDWSDPLGDVSRGCAGTETRGAVAAQNPHITLVRVGLGNPYELVVTRLWFSSTTTQQIAIVQPSALAGQVASANTSFTDFRLPGRPASQLGTLSQVGLTPGRQLFSGVFLANTINRLDVHLRLGTFGDGVDLTALAIVGQTVNSTLHGGFEWTESSPLG